METPRGIYTSEFWTAIVSAATAMLAAISQLNAYIQAVIIAGATLIVCCYIISRGLAKSKIN